MKTTIIIFICIAFAIILLGNKKANAIREIGSSFGSIINSEQKIRIKDYYIPIGKIDFINKINKNECYFIEIGIKDYNVLKSFTFDSKEKRDANYDAIIIYKNTGVLDLDYI